jgi:hypothetical protein
MNHQELDLDPFLVDAGGVDAVFAVRPGTCTWNTAGFVVVFAGRVSTQGGANQSAIVFSQLERYRTAAPDASLCTSAPTIVGNIRARRIIGKIE